MGWMIAASGASMLLVYFNIIHQPVLGYAIAGLNLALLAVMAYQLFITIAMSYRIIFIAANLFMMIVMLSLVADRFMNS